MPAFSISRMFLLLGWYRLENYGTSVIMEKFSWSERDFHIAKTLIMRTEYPFNENQPDPKTSKISFPEGDWLNYNDGYTGSSPVQRYEEMLQDAILSKEDQAAE